MDLSEGGMRVEMPDDDLKKDDKVDVMLSTENPYRVYVMAAKIVWVKSSESGTEVGMLFDEGQGLTEVETTVIAGNTANISVNPEKLTMSEN